MLATEIENHKKKNHRMSTMFIVQEYGAYTRYFWQIISVNLSQLL